MAPVSTASRRGRGAAVWNLFENVASAAVLIAVAAACLSVPAFLALAMAGLR